MLHIVVRSFGGENKKQRPEYYSKTLALASLVRSAQALPAGAAEIVFLNDGPIPAERVRLMEQSGEVVEREDHGLKHSLLSTLRLPTERRWPADDLVWFAEDDYLYQLQAFQALTQAAATLPAAAYFGLYALIGARLPNGRPFDANRVPNDWQDSDPVTIAGHPWRRALSTTSTFGARVGALAADLGMIRLAMRSGSDWDHSTCLMYQGFLPFRSDYLMTTLGNAERYGPPPRRAAIVGLRLALNLYQMVRARRPQARKLLMAADPPLITHLETEHMAVGAEWPQLAREIDQWLRQTTPAPTDRPLERNPIG